MLGAHDRLDPAADARVEPRQRRGRIAHAHDPFRDAPALHEGVGQLGATGKLTDTFEPAVSTGLGGHARVMATAIALTIERPRP